jgi:hypothetical protein
MTVILSDRPLPGHYPEGLVTNDAVMEKLERDTATLASPPPKVALNLSD